METTPQIIETARDHHIPGIVAIAEKLKMNPQESEPEKLKKGFLVYTLDARGYSRRLNEFFVVETSGERVGGFLMCYDRNFIQSLIEEGQEEHERGILNFIQSVEPVENFVYGGEIGVDPKARQQGIGRKMLERVFALMRDKGIRRMYAAILHGPVQNLTSIAFATATGAENIGEARNDDGLLWGLYRWSVSEDGK